MFGKVYGIGLLGVEGCLVCVEVDVQEGLPAFIMVGALAPEVREAQDRVRTALRNADFRFPPKKVTVNLSPAGVRKSGTGFDLAIAAAVLGAYGAVPWEEFGDAVFLGELGLDGRVKPVRGILPMVMEARKRGKRRCFLPEQNVREGQMIPGIEMIGVSGAAELAERMRAGGGAGAPEILPAAPPPAPEQYEVDFREVRGQALMKRATEVAVAGRHNILYIGPAGTGKTMVARRIPTIMPSCTREEQLEITKIYSICGLLPAEQPLMRQRPFRSPHHSVTAQALTGGGRDPSPGELSLASGGVLFLDELPEFSRHVIETLRQPLESRRIVLSRVNGRYEFPADFMLVAAANPCPCGHYPDRNRCRCSDDQIRRYLGRISKPILDRIDICTETSPIRFEDLRGGKEAESSERIRARVEEVRQIQKRRFADRGAGFNSGMTAADLQRYCRLTRGEELFFREFYRKSGLSVRAYSKILKVARTIADLDGSDDIGHAHLCEAIGYRSLEEKYWKSPSSAGAGRWEA